MHQEIRDYLSSIKAKYPAYFKGKEVLEAGSLNINGSPREYFEDCDYCGVDVGEGPGVDIITPVHQLLNPNQLEETKKYGRPRDVVVSTEMLEHDSNWDKSLEAMAEMVKPGGLLIITCAGPKRAEHGTTRTDTYSSPHTTDYYRNLDAEDFMDHLKRSDFTVYHLTYGRGGEDIMFYGIKKGPAPLAKIEEPVLVTKVSGAVPVLPVTVCIPTKERYDVLHLCLLSIAMQTAVPSEIIIVDDTDNPMDIRTDQNYVYVLKLLHFKGVDWKVQFGKKQGQHHSHQTVQKIAKNDIIFRIDDDEIAEPGVIEGLFSMMVDNPDVGAVAPCVLMPDPQPLPPMLQNNISYEMDSPNVQWFKFDHIVEAQHLYSSFMYRKGINDFNLNLSVVCHREETLFTHGIVRLGYKLLINGSLRVWHFRGNGGGIRTQRDPALWQHDEMIFQKQLKDWGIQKSNKKVVVLDSGLGDHFAFKQILPDLLKKTKDITIASCFPDAFWDYPDIKQISIAEAKLLYSNIDQFQIYKWMWDHDWKKPLTEAFRELYINS